MTDRDIIDRAVEAAARGVDPEAFVIWEFERQRATAEPGHWQQGDWAEMDGWKATRQQKARDRARAALAAFCRHLEKELNPRGDIDESAVSLGWLAALLSAEGDDK